MKWLLYILIISICSLCYSQDTVLLKSMKLTNRNLKYLYSGVNNVIQIDNYDSSFNYLLNSKTLNIKKITASKFYILTPINEPHFIQAIIQDNYGDTVVIDTFKYYETGLPDFTLTLGSISYSGTKEEILKQNKINVILENCYWNHNFRIFNSSLIFIIENKVYEKDCGKDGMITKEQKKLMNELEPGDKIILYNVVGEIPGGHGLRIDDKLIEVVDH